jgi:O-antigen/teichoic acid export membrane protein
MPLRPFDRLGAFAPSVPGVGGALRRAAVRSAGVTIFSGSAALAIQVVSTVVLARLLMPRDFGLVAMVTTFSLLLMNFGLNGLTEAVVQRETIDNALASNLFWINIIGGLVLTGLFAAAGSLMARFYGEPLVAPIAAGISPCIFLTSASVLHLGLLKRAMRFTAVSMNDIVARLVSVVVSIFFGWKGWGYWALVIGACALPLSSVVGAWILCRWLPRLPRKVPGTGSMVSFAMNTYGWFTINYITRNTDNLLVGWRFGSSALGFYKKAYDLFTLPTMQLVASNTVVAVSALSRVKDDRILFRRYLLGAITVVAFVGMGLSGDLTLVGRDLIRVVLGAKWGPAGEIFTLFAPGIGMMIVYNTHGWIHLSIGRADRWLRWGFVEWGVTCLLFLGGLPWGPKGIAVAWGVSSWLLIVPAIQYAGKPIGLGAGSVVAAIWRYVAAALLAGIALAVVPAHSLAFVAGAGVGAAALRVLAVSAVYTIVYIGCVVLLHGGLEPLRRMAGLLAEIVPASRRSSPAARVSGKVVRWSTARVWDKMLFKPSNGHTGYKTAAANADQTSHMAEAHHGNPDAVERRA